MSSPHFPSLDPVTLRLREKHVPERLLPPGLIELIQDSVGSMAVGTSPVSAVYNDTLGNLTIALDMAALTEVIQDVVGALVAAAGGSYNDANGTITLPSGGSAGQICRMHRSGAQTVAAGSIQGIILNALSFNDSNTYFSTDTATGRITALQAGTYQASWAVRFGAATSGERYSSIAVNGVTNTRSEAGGTRADLHTATGSASIRLLANEYVNLCAYVSNASVDIQGGNQFHSWLSLARLGA